MQTEKTFSVQNALDLSGALALVLRILAKPFSLLLEVASAPRIVAAEVVVDDRVVYRFPQKI